MTTIAITYSNDFPITLLAGADYLQHQCAALSAIDFATAVCAWYGELSTEANRALGDVELEFGDVIYRAKMLAGDEPDVHGHPNDPDTDCRAWLAWNDAREALVADAVIAWRSNVIAAIGRAEHALILLIQVPA